MWKCPGQDMRNIKPDDVVEQKCNFCGEIVELWPPGYRAKCQNCGNEVAKESVPSCADWCPGGEAMVKECLGEERYQEWKKSKEKKSADPQKTLGEKPEKTDDMSHRCFHEHNCIEELRADHEKILVELDMLEKAVDGNKIDMAQVEKFLDFCDTFAEPHHRKEEEVLFPELEKRGIPKDGGPIGVMLTEHEMRRGLVNVLRDSFRAGDRDKIKGSAEALIALLRDHIFKENNVLYPMAQSLLTEEDLAELGCRCSQIVSR